MGIGFWTGKELDVINWGGTIEAENFKTASGSVVVGTTTSPPIRWNVTKLQILISGVWVDVPTI